MYVKIWSGWIMNMSASQFLSPWKEWGDEQWGDFWIRRIRIYVQRNFLPSKHFFALKNAYDELYANGGNTPFLRPPPERADKAIFWRANSKQFLTKQLANPNSPWPSCTHEKRFLRNAGVVSISTLITKLWRQYTTNIIHATCMDASN